jgi:Leucine-rich repeat (LRR) protein
VIEQDEVEDVIDLNEKILCLALGGIDVSELTTLTKIELRVDSSIHNLQVTGEILPSLDILKLNDSVIRCFRDIGTSFKNVRVLHIARCEIREAQGIQAFEQLEELYISFNEIDDLFDISFLEHLSVLDFEGNNVSSTE